MPNRLIRGYFKVPLSTRILVGFAIGIATGILLWHMSHTRGDIWLKGVLDWFMPFGNILLDMLKMIVIPIVFFSLVTGSASLSLKKFGSLGGMVIVWFTTTSLIAAVLGTGIAFIISPGKGTDRESFSKLAHSLIPQAQEIGLGMSETKNQLIAFISNLFKNPFEALSTGNFLSIIVFALLFGLATRVLLDTLKNKEEHSVVAGMLKLFQAAQAISFKIVDWVMEYFPFGIFALTTVNFGLYGSELFGPYMKIAAGVVLGVLMMIFVIYPALIFFITYENPFKVMYKMQKAILTAFVTRSSAVALPVSMQACEEELGISNELAGFSLPLGSTINMDGVCIHLPVFAILAANLFHIHLGPGQILLLIVSVVVASIGTGGVPSGSLMLMFIILQSIGLNYTQTSVIVALAMGINPLIDMFETASNVAGDNVCTYIVAHSQGMIKQRNSRRFF
ncbi:dicarboxylate/amino acid:cation symporter [Lentisphaerota bacterium ZTH]|nr:dicarboxylate/amino acid:cation symporter [Lentisphaerota bacterium]WET06161.1 dicarboxylate/amino acid:cation symporter [Lentisphaerota bacterium ZTH]